MKTKFNQSIWRWYCWRNTKTNKRSKPWTFQRWFWFTNNEVYAAFGVLNKKDVIKHGVQIGNNAFFNRRHFATSYNPNLVAGKAMDNRAGVTIMTEIIKELNDVVLDNETYFINSAQKETENAGDKGLPYLEFNLILHNCFRYNNK